MLLSVYNVMLFRKTRVRRVVSYKTCGKILKPKKSVKEWLYDKHENARVYVVILEMSTSDSSSGAQHISAMRNNC